jgi:hypothetical protein
MTFGISAGTYLMAGTALVGGMMASKGASSQANAANRAADLSQQQYEQTRADQEPWRQAGVRGLNKFESMADYKPFDMATFAQDPSYQFRMDQGMKAIERSAAARGRQLGGNTLGSLQSFGQGLASQEYGNAFNRYQTERQATLAPYMTLAGFGTGANAANAQAGQNYATNAGNYMTGAAAAGAAGNMGIANALGGGASQYLKYTQGNDLLSAIKGGNSPSNADLVNMYMK